MRTHCPRIHEILAAQRAESVTQELRAHLQLCGACRDALAAEAATRAIAGRLEPFATLPPASRILLRAHLAARREAAERTMRPLAIWRGIVVTVAAAGIALGLALGRPVFESWSSASAAAQGPSPAQSLAGVGLLLLAVLPFWKGRSNPIA